ncbi:MAG: hypothetical protein JW910_11485 [Anaerolineae bacterium]|nr:hypothetical protein [Anaerolineae bacterium]
MPSFHERLAEVIDRQYALYEPYRTLCAMEDVSREDLHALITDDALHAIPAIPAEWFKRDKGKGLFKQLANFDLPGAWLISSSTSGDPSYIWRTEADRQAIADSFDRAYRHVPAAKSVAFSPTADFLQKVGERFAIDERPVLFYAVIPSRTAAAVFQDMDSLAQLNTLKTLWAMVKSRGKGRPVLELQTHMLRAAIENAVQTRTDLVFSASVLMLYPALSALPGPYALGDNAHFLTGAGGWDGAKGTTSGAAIHKPTYVREMSEKFGLLPERANEHFWDIYGTTENGKAQVGHYVPEYEDFVFTVEEDTVRLYVIDPVSGEPATAGGQGYPRFVSPHGVDGFAGACVQQNDIVTVVSTNDDGSVRQFTHIGRASGGEGEGGVGCAFEMVEGVQL